MTMQETLTDIIQRFSDMIVFLDADWGNRLWKQMQLGDRASATVMENSIVMLDENGWNKQVARAKTSPARFSNTQIFGYRSRGKDNISRSGDKMNYVLAGNAAKYNGKVKTMTEEVKYSYNNYWGAVVCANLLSMYPNGEQHIVLALAHPSKSIGQRDQMVAATMGEHFVQTLDGRKLKFVVREILSWEEPVGGIVRWGESDEFKYNSLDLKLGDQLVVADMGGGVTSLTRVIIEKEQDGRLRFQPIYDQNQSPSISMGIRTVMERLRIQLSENNAAFAGMKDINDQMLEEGIRTKQITLKGDPVDVTNEVNMAEFELLDTIENNYLQNLDGGRPFRGIINTGGGMETYYERLNTEVWKHPYVYRSASTNLHLANLQGGDQIFQQWIEDQRRIAKLKSGNAKSQWGDKKVKPKVKGEDNG